MMSWLAACGHSPLGSRQGGSAGEVPAKTPGALAAKSCATGGIGDVLVVISYVGSEGRFIRW